MADNFPRSPEGWVERNDTFLDEAEKPENAGELDSDSAELLAWRGQNNVVAGLLDSRESLTEQLKGVNAQLKVEGPELEGLSRAGFGRASKSSASAELKAEAGVTIPKPRVLSAPKVPLNLVATANANGTVFLSYLRNGNIASADFIIEKRVGTGEWMLQDVVRKVSKTLQAKVAERAAFRVSARNGKGTSLPSNEAVIYDD